MKALDTAKLLEEALNNLYDCMPAAVDSFYQDNETTVIDVVIRNGVASAEQSELLESLWDDLNSSVKFNTEHNEDIYCYL